MSILFAESDDERCERLQAELDRVKKEHNELRECVAMASRIISLVGTTDANSSDNIRRSDHWLAISRKLIAKTKPE